VGGWAISAFTSCGLIAKVVLGVLGDRIDPRYVWASTMAAFAVGLMLIVDARSPMQLYGSAAAIGYGFGGGVVCMMTVLSNYYGFKAFSSLAGLAIAIQTTASFIGRNLAGYHYEAERVATGIGSFATPFQFFALWSFVGMLVLLFVRPPRRGVRNEPVPEPASG
jgi:MFS family permease